MNRARPAYLKPTQTHMCGVVADGRKNSRDHVVVDHCFVRALPFVQELCTRSRGKVTEAIVCEWGFD
jgi:hypothetical protein